MGCGYGRKRLQRDTQCEELLAEAYCDLRVESIRFAQSFSEDPEVMVLFFPLS